MWKINCDLGEGVGNDEALMPFISACSIACGGHAGDENTMRKTVQLAMKHGVNIGAHPSFPDKENFGRKPMNISHEDLKLSINTQIDSLLHICNEMKTSLHHIKAHGALYNLASKDQKIAQCMLDACRNFTSIPFFAPYGSLFARLAREQGHLVIYEAFADRAYNDDLSLVDRSHDLACLTESAAVKSQVHHIARHQEVKTITGGYTKLLADTYCVHGDNPNAMEIVKSLTNL